MIEEGLILIITICNLDAAIKLQTVAPNLLADCVHMKRERCSKEYSSGLEFQTDSFKTLAVYSQMISTGRLLGRILIFNLVNE